MAVRTDKRNIYNTCHINIWCQIMDYLWQISMYHSLVHYISACNNKHIQQIYDSDWCLYLWLYGSRQCHVVMMEHWDNPTWLSDRSCCGETHLQTSYKPTSIVDIIMYIYIYMNGGQNHCLFWCANQGGPLSVVKISAFTDFQAIHAKQWYRMVSV